MEVMAIVEFTSKNKGKIYKVSSKAINGDGLITAAKSQVLFSSNLQCWTGQVDKFCTRLEQEKDSIGFSQILEWWQSSVTKPGSKYWNQVIKYCNKTNFKGRKSIRKLNSLFPKNKIDGFIYFKCLNRYISHFLPFFCFLPLLGLAFYSLTGFFCFLPLVGLAFCSSTDSQISSYSSSSPSSDYSSLSYSAYSTNSNYFSQPYSP